MVQNADQGGQGWLLEPRGHPKRGRGSPISDFWASFSDMLEVFFGGFLDDFFECHCFIEKNEDFRKSASRNNGSTVLESQVCFWVRSESSKMLKMHHPRG